MGSPCALQFLPVTKVRGGGSAGMTQVGVSLLTLLGTHTWLMPPLGGASPGHAASCREHVFLGLCMGCCLASAVGHQPAHH